MQTLPASIPTPLAPATRHVSTGSTGAATLNQLHDALCDVCSRQIRGIRHRCLDCPDFDICAACFVPEVHFDGEHRFRAITEPGQAVVRNVPEPPARPYGLFQTNVGMFAPVVDEEVSTIAKVGASGSSPGKPTRSNLLATVPDPAPPQSTAERSTTAALSPSINAPDDQLLLEALVSTPPAPPSSSSIPGLPSSVPFMGLSTGYEPPRFAKVEAGVVAAQAQSIQGNLQALRQQEPAAGNVVPGGPRTILEEVQQVDRRVSALEKQLGPGKPSISTRSMKHEVDDISAILKGILNRIFPQPRDLTSTLSPDYQRALDQALSILAMLASSIFLLPECDDSMEYFALSESCLVLAAEVLPKGHIAAPVIASHLGTLYFQRFQFSGVAKNIKMAINMHQQSVDAGPNDHPKRAMFLGWLGRSYIALFEVDQNAEDLKKAMELNLKAWENIQSKVDEATREERKHILEGKSRALQCLVEHVGGLNNTSLLNLGIGEWRTTLLDLLKRHDTQDEVKAGCMRTLGFLYITRFDQLGGQHQTDIDRSLTFLAMAIALLPEQHSDLRSTLCILAHSLVSRPSSSESEDKANSDLAFEYLELAKELTPVKHAFEPHLRASYGDIHMALSRKAKVPTSKEYHLMRAIGHHQAVLNYSTCHPGSRLWAKARQKLGRCRFYKYNDSKSLASPQVEELKLSLREFISIVLAPRGHLFDRFMAACSWAKYASSHPAFWKQALCGYETAIELIPLLACFGAVPGQRRKATQKSGQLATEAAAFAIEAGEYSLALTLLEQGRSVKWNHMLQLQTPLNTLKAQVGGKKLAEELEDLLKRLQLEEENPALHDLTGHSPYKDLDLQNQYQRLLDQIRKIQGFAHFMRPRAAEDLMKAARNGPVVVINVHISRCDALIVHPINNNKGIQLVKLPELAPDKIIHMRDIIDQSLEEIGGTRAVGSKSGGEAGRQQKRTEPIDRLEEQLKNLWDWVVHPILKGLGYGSRPKEPRHVTWCATGPLSFLPLHAAGDYRNTGIEKTFEYVISSYTPTLGALLTDVYHEVLPKPHCDLLLVNPELANPEHGSESGGLPGAQAEIECIEKRFKVATSSFPQWAVEGVDAVVSLFRRPKDTMDSQSQPKSEPALKIPDLDDESDEPNSNNGPAPNVPENAGPPRLTRLEGSHANPNAVYEAMQKHDWIHLACHAVQNDGNPAMCGFYLGGELLPLQRIARMRYKKRGLAFLSACQTAKGDQNLPDEAIHLASGMLMSGYSNVIATMWPVRDADAPFVANDVYNRLLVGDKMRCGRSAAALHSALANLRKDLEVKNLGRVALAYWIPFIHYGA
ncbi:unnamed protein product [Rhizoctonia solani]|uniref:ZZ-type domain-containing protein n=1 Tax=Rhizoctonia solani TaxID=456999 RepID=A0A8H3AT11_9AGAM|nr:unnamed protein product [Rhizoctonia solani]